MARGSVCLVLQAPAGRLESLTLSPPGEMWAWARNLHVTRTCYPTTPRLPVGTGRRWYVAQLGSDPHSLTAFGTGGAATWAGSGSHGRGRTLGRWRGTRAQRVLPCPGCYRCWLHWLRRYSPRRRGGPEGTTPEWPLHWRGGGGHLRVPFSVTETSIWSFRPLTSQFFVLRFCAPRLLCTRAIALTSFRRGGGGQACWVLCSTIGVERHGRVLSSLSAPSPNFEQAM